MNAFWRALRLLVTALSIVFLISPLLIVIVVSFTAAPFLAFPPPAYSLRWYETLFSKPVWIDATKISLQVTPIAVLLATILGTAAAYGGQFLRGAPKTLVMIVMLSPLVVPVIVIAVGMYGLSIRYGIDAGVPALIFAHTVLIVPYPFVLVSAALEVINPRLEAAALTLGATRPRAFRYVIVPLILPAVVSGALFAFVISFDEVIVSSFLTRPGQRTIAVQMWSDVLGTTDPTIAALATILFALSMLVLLASRIVRKPAGAGAADRKQAAA
ncbi:MAG: ABC transporter permease [Pseudorhodoplanes sp.]